LKIIFALTRDADFFSINTDINFFYLISNIFTYFFINTYGIFLKFFLQLNGGYWSRIGLTENISEERIKKRRLYILPFYILLALLFGLLSALYWYLVILYVPLLIERYLSPLNNSIALIIAFASFFGWLYILCKTK